MAPIRVLLADDSAAVRLWLADHLSDEKDVEVVGSAHDGRGALALARETRPDVLILDYEMPGLTGAETLKELHRQNPEVRVLMFSQHTSRGAEATLDALLAGASDYLPKPAGSQSPEESKAYMTAHLVPKLRALVTPHVHGILPRTGFSNPTQRVDLVVVGVSTGGPEALSRLLHALPRQLPVPLLVVQHMPPLFTGLLAERLQEQCGRPVREATAGMPLGPDLVLIAPGNRHLELAGTPGAWVASLHDGPAVQSCRPSVDVLFRSAARGAGAHCLGVVMTGMGQDSLDGCQELRAAGGRILVQDPASCVIWGMPGAVHAAGLADAALDPEGLAQEIARRVALGRAGVAP